MRTFGAALGEVVEDVVLVGVERVVEDEVEIRDWNSSDACCSFCNESLAASIFSEDSASNADVGDDA